MTNEKFRELLQKLHTTELQMFNTKGIDYGSEDDAQACFRAVENDTGVSAQAALYVFMLKHLRALAEYCRTGETKSSEDITDRIIDLRLYLAHMIALKEA